MTELETSPPREQAAVASAPRSVQGTEESGQWVRILPGSITRGKPTAAHRAKMFRSHLARVRQIVKGDIKCTFFGKSLGWLWLFIEPVLFAGLYWFITAVLFTMSGIQAESRFLYILVSIVFWVWFSRSLNNAPFLFAGQGSLLRDTNFPIFLLLATFVTKELVFLGLNFVVMICFLLGYGRDLHWAILSLPIVFIPMFLLMLVMTMALSIVGTFIKDLAGFLNPIISIWWYVSPAMFPAKMVETKVGADSWVYTLYALNPFFYFFQDLQKIFLDGQVPDLVPLLVMTVVLLVPLLGLCWVYKRVRYYYYQFL